MRHGHVLAVLAVLGALAACANDDDRETRDRDVGGIYEPGVGGRGLLIRPGADPNKIFSDAMDLKAKNDCAGAIVKLRRVAVMGPGYENAQAALGECLTQGNQSAEPSSDYLEGVVWLRRAADAGWPEAQALLASAYALGPGVMRNGEEAAYWLALYDSNPTKLRVGFVPATASALDAVRKTLTAADRESAARRAAQWQRKVWLPPAPAPGTQTPGEGPRRSPQRQRTN